MAEEVARTGGGADRQSCVADAVNRVKRMARGVAVSTEILTPPSGAYCPRRTCPRFFSQKVLQIPALDTFCIVNARLLQEKKGEVRVTCGISFK